MFQFTQEQIQNDLDGYNQMTCKEDMLKFLKNSSSLYYNICGFFLQNQKFAGQNKIQKETDIGE